MPIRIKAIANFWFPIFFVLIGFKGLSQETKLRKRHSVGVSLGYSFANEHIGDRLLYKPWLLMLDWEIPIDKNSLLEIYLEPHANLVQIVGTNPFFSEWEVGLNGGIKFNFPIITTPYTIFGSIGSGPHYITEKSKLQASGFNFSDNFSFGSEISISRHSALIFQVRFRHVSNLGFKEPNFGLDNWFLTIGWVRAVGR